MFICFCFCIIYYILLLATDFQIAHGTFAKTEGLVVDIWNRKLGVYLFDCSFFSDYTDENERFFIGGLQQFSFISIHHMKRKENYESWIKPICILVEMFAGFPFEMSRVKTIDLEALSLLILNSISASTTSEIYQIPVYISKLFINFVNNVQQIEINIFLMNKHLEYAKQGFFCYKLLKPLFFLANQNTNSETINYSKLLQIFKRKLKTIMVYNIKAFKKFNQSIYLDDLFLHEILNGISTIKSSVILSSIFDKFLIVEPYDNIQHFIEKNKNKFNKIGWKLNYIQYKHPKRGVVAKNCLQISQM